MRCALRALILAVIGLLISTQYAAYATHLPEGLVHAIKATSKGCKIRIDGAIEDREDNLFLPVLPPVAQEGTSKSAVELELAYPDKEHATAFMYSNGYGFVKVERVGTYRTIVLPTKMPGHLRNQLTAGKFPEDLIVPEAFVLPKSLFIMAGKLPIRVVADDLLGQSKLAIADHCKTAAPDAILVTSVKNGSIIVLDEKSLSKVAEFPTEGTPTGMVYFDGRVYIADQAKNRVLILDCEKKSFLGQINLLPKSAPSDIATLPNGKLLYVSERSTDDIAIIETITRKVLMRTRVSAGPGKLAITPNGALLLALHVPSGQVSILSTANQRVLAQLRVGNGPSDVAVTSDNQTAYVSNRMSNSISVIDLAKKQVIGSIPSGVGPTGIALSLDNSTLYVVNARENSLGAYNLKNRKRVNLVKLPAEIDFPSNICLTPDGKQLLITSEGTDGLVFFDLSTLSFDRATAIGCPSHKVLFIALPH